MSFNIGNAKGRGLACLLLAIWLLLAIPSALAQTVYQYSNTTIGTINDVDCGTAGQVSRTINVPTSYTVGDVNLGVLLSHTYRSDLRITLTSPAGTSVTVMTWAGNVQSGDNLNDLFDDEATGAISTHVAGATDPLTPVPPPYSHSFRPSNPLSAFDGQNAQGNWTMIVCDAVAQDVGQFQRADLFISPIALSVVKSSNIVSDPVSASNPKMIPGAIVEYCLLVSNVGATGVADSINVSVSDPIPAAMSYVAGSLRSGTTCATATTLEDDDATGTDENDPLGMAASGSVITGSAATLAATASIALIFRAKIN